MSNIDATSEPGLTRPERAIIPCPCEKCGPGHSDVSTTMIYTHVLKVGGSGVRSPVDSLAGTFEPAVPGIEDDALQHPPVAPWRLRQPVGVYAVSRL